MKNAFIVFAMGCLTSTVSFGFECTSIITELQAMKRAQSTIQMSLVANHNIFADTMESYADALSSTAGRAHRTVSGSMTESSISFRDRGQKAKLTAEKLDSATADLIQKIKSCLK